MPELRQRLVVYLRDLHGTQAEALQPDLRGLLCRRIVQERHLNRPVRDRRPDVPELRQRLVVYLEHLHGVQTEAEDLQAAGLRQVANLPAESRVQRLLRAQPAGQIQLHRRGRRHGLQRPGPDQPVLGVVRQAHRLQCIWPPLHRADGRAGGPLDRQSDVRRP